MSQPSWYPVAGQIISDRYRLNEVIGRGGMGVVLSGQDLKLARDVAVKFLDPDHLENEQSLDRFQREAKAAGQIGHENICDVRDIGTTSEGAPYIVMELLEGESLARLMAREKQLSTRQAVDIIRQALAGLQAVHDLGLVHRDLKPENIFLCSGGGGQLRVKLLDFGISKHLHEMGDLRLTKTGTVMGSPYYMSPEQARGSEHIDSRSDLWSLGVILYEALCGQMPFQGPNYNQVMVKIITETPTQPRELRSDLCPALEKVLHQALTKERVRRFPSADAFADALASVVGSEPSEPLRVVVTPSPGFGLAAVTASPEQGLASTGSGQRSQELTVSLGGGRGRRRRFATLAALVLVAGVIAGLATSAFLVGQQREAVAESWSHHPSPGTAEENAISPEGELIPLSATLAADLQPEEEEEEQGGQGAQRERAARPEQVEVELRGVPAAAQVTFDGRAVEGDHIVGPLGHRGLLVVEVSGAEVYRGELVLAPQGIVDGSGWRVSRRRETRRRGRSQAGGSDKPEAPAGSGFIHGRGGSKVLLDYGDE
jgi:serine/threonine protein kinase